MLDLTKFSKPFSENTQQYRKEVYKELTMSTKNLYNLSSCKLVRAESKTCPKCKGGGRDSMWNEDSCDICNGYGWAWISPCGWTMYPYERTAGRLY